jgi:large subunit ribosomal protein L7Ae
VWEVYEMAEVSKEIMDKAFEAIEAARGSGKIKKGANEVTKSIERQTAKLVVVAKDVQPPEVVMHLPLLAAEKSVPCVQVESREELGAAAGLHVPTTAVAIEKEGKAASLIKEVVAALNKKE